MRTRLELDDDRLAANPASSAVLRLLRHPLTAFAWACRALRPQRSAVAGFEPFAAKRGVVTTHAQVDALRDAEGL